jgi:hypothetical protein
MSAPSQRNSRRRFLKTLAAAATTRFIPYTATANAQEKTVPKSPNERLRIGCIGMRYQGSVIAREALPFGDIVAICDVDRHVREQARASFGSTAALFENYQDLLARKDIDVVLIGTPSGPERCLLRKAADADDRRRSESVRRCSELRPRRAGGDVAAE